MDHPRWRFQGLPRAQPDRELAQRRHPVRGPWLHLADPAGLYPRRLLHGRKPDLDPETSTNREIGISFGNDLVDAGLTYFHTDFRNKIEYAPLGRFNGIWWTRMSNVRARTSGMEGNLISASASTGAGAPRRPG